jgi:hypothetical protein
VVNVLTREDVEMHLHAPETKTEHIWLCVVTNSHTDSSLGNDLWTIGYSWSLAVIRALRMIIDPAEYEDFAAQIITDPLPCFAFGTRHSGL